MRRLLLSLASVSLVAAFFATPPASAQQSVNFFVGGFVPTPIDARGDNSGSRSNDVLVRDQDVFAFRFDRFKGATFGGEYLAPLGNFFEAGASIGFYQRTVPAIDNAFVDPQGRDIAANFQLRIVPFNATFRVLPLGHGVFEPYVGGGIGVFGWRYSETGDFVLANGAISRNEVNVATGTAVGPVVLGGLRFPMGPVVPGFEIRWQKAKGDLGVTTPVTPGRDFGGSVVDLGGMNYLFTIAIRF